MQADGTYKLHRGGWTLCDLGSHICRWDASTRKSVHTFYPLLYMFCRTECRDAYVAFFETLRAIPTALFGAAEPLNVACGGLDRSTFIAEAYFQVWPHIKLLLCWTHLARKFASNEFWAKLKVKDNKQLFEKHIRALHACRSEGQFRRLSSLILRVWVALDELVFAEYFEEYYVRDHWGNWFTSASPIPGVLPNAQGIESGHKIQKLVIGRYARVRCALRAAPNRACSALRRPPRLRQAHLRRRHAARRARARAHTDARGAVFCPFARAFARACSVRRESLRAATTTFLATSVPKILAQAGMFKLSAAGYRSDGPLVADTLYEAQELLSLTVPYVVRDYGVSLRASLRVRARARRIACQFRLIRSLLVLALRGFAARAHLALLPNAQRRTRSSRSTS